MHPVASSSQSTFSGGGFAPIEIDSDTCPGRYLHILLDIFEKVGKSNPNVLQTLDLSGHKILIVGPGAYRIPVSFFDIATKSNSTAMRATSPQATEVLLMDAVVSVCDSQHGIVDSLKDQPLYFLPDSYSTLTNTFMKLDCDHQNPNSKEKAALAGRIINKIVSNTAQSPFKKLNACVLWDPSNPQTEAPAELGKFDSIIMTHSTAAFPCEMKVVNVYIAYARLIRMLNPNGTLYVDRISHSIAYQNDWAPSIENQLGSQLIFRTVKKILKPADDHLQRIKRHPGKFTESNLHVCLNGVLTLSRSGQHNASVIFAVSEEVVAITRVLQMTIEGNTYDFIEMLEKREFKAPGNLEYWHSIAKTKNTAQFYVPRDALTSVETKLGALWYQKVTDKEGWNPLHVAVIANNRPAIGYFLNKGASPLVQDKFGLTPLDYAKHLFPDLTSLLDTQGGPSSSEAI